jgi:Na+/pantothenate symporter
MIGAVISFWNKNSPILWLSCVSEGVIQAVLRWPLLYRLLWQHRRRNTASSMQSMSAIIALLRSDTWIVGKSDAIRHPRPD